MAEQEPLLEVRPSYWNYFWYWVFFWLLIPPIMAWWNRQSQILRVYEDRVSLEKGVLAKELTEYFVEDIRAIEVRQSLFQRIVKIGDIEIGTAASEEDDEEIFGIPDPLAVKNLITSKRQARGPRRPND